MKALVRTATLLALGATVPAGLAVADSFTPVRLTVDVAPVARLHARLSVTVHVSADASVLDTRSAPLRVRVRLARECGGTFESTTGVVLMDKQLSPQPTTGKPYSAVAHGAGRPAAYGAYTVCTYLEEEGDNRMFANDTSTTTTVSRRCTAAANRYDELKRSRRARKHEDRIARARRAARRACGPGVPL